MNDSDPPLSPTAVRAAGDVWIVFSRLRRRLRALDGEDDLSPAQAAVLKRLSQHGPASASELAAAEGVRAQSMAKNVAALEAAGLVERHPDPYDGRRRPVTLTERGREQRLGDLRARQAWLARALQEHGGEEELRAVVTAMALLDEVAQS
ncbi:MarR family winged helix-turn-helix transcriptional regulator [Streptomyces phytohabitans]|uniref:MarR family winged helix-turn-helix transcriptional regulator n=1 Tax=Streptomyces phytohabitans TaxID=1150371 RepID=UPI00345B55CA